MTTQGNKEWGYRSSVWVNQEISILADRKQFEGVEIRILVLKDKKVHLEGAMTSLIVTPIPMNSESEILKQIESWLKTTEFPLSSSANEDRLLSKWEKLSYTSRNVKESSIRVSLRENYD